MVRIINNLEEKYKRRTLRKNQTKEEKIVWSKLRNNQTGYKWRRQVSIGRYVADFYCRQKLLVVEIDGTVHKHNKEYDKDREEYFTNLGIKTMRFWNSEVNQNINNVVEKIKFTLQNSPSPNQERGLGGEVLKN